MPINKLTESRLRQIIKEELSTMTPAAGAPVVVSIFVSPDGGEVEFPPAVDDMPASVDVRERVEDLFSMAEMPGEFGRAMRASVPFLSKLGITHVVFQTGGDSAEPTPIPLAAAGKALTAIVRRAMRSYDY